MSAEKSLSKPEESLRGALARAPAAPAWLAALKDAGRAAFEARGLPTRRVEAWKYSDLRRALEADVIPAARGARAALSLADADTVTIADGVLPDVPELEGVELLSLRDALADAPGFLRERLGRVHPQADHALIGLNTALMDEGLVLRVPAGVSLRRPLHVRFVASGEGRHLRLFVRLEEGARATLIESHEGPGARGLTTIVSEADLQPGAGLTHVRLEALDAPARQAAVLLGAVASDASYEGFYLSLGAAFSRHEALIALSGAQANAVINGAYLVGGTRHCDNTTVLRHAVPHTASRQMFRGVLAGQGRGVFQGRVAVEPGAQHTDAQQQSRALLLSRRAEIAAKPELEILADDVKCSHGATAGALDPAALFFLRARGIEESEARALLVEAFLEQSLADIARPDVQALARGLVRDWLAAQAGDVTHAD